jgi:hypothetical protein
MAGERKKPYQVPAWEHLPQGGSTCHSRTSEVKGQSWAPQKHRHFDRGHPNHPLGKRMVWCTVHPAKRLQTKKGHKEAAQCRTTGILQTPKCNHIGHWP